MAKVIVERPRYGSRYKKAHKSYQKVFERCDWDDQPKRESRRHRVSWRKPFNEHLGPLRRFLQSCVGRPWRAVHAEICENLRRDSVIQDHVRDHVNDYVATQVLLIDGRPCSGSGRDYGQPLGLSRWRHLFYVCPRSGLLKMTPGRKAHPPRPPAQVVVLDAGRACLLEDGVWWLIRVKPFPPPGPAEPLGLLDAVLGRHLSRADAVEFYGAAVHGVARERRLSKREMKQLPIPIDLQRLNRQGRVVRGSAAPNRNSK